jgi:sporulation and spore germination protein/immunoglobulin-like protein involved in spore germination
MRFIRPRWRTVALASVLLTTVFACARERQAPGPTEKPPLAPDALRAVTIYFSDAEAMRVVPVTRYADPDSGLARGAVRALLAGPDSAERARGLATAIPPGTRLLGLTIRDSVATVDLTRAFEAGGGSASIRMRLAQLVYTLTQLPGVRRVRLHLEGQAVEVFSGEGLDVSRPLDRGDFADLKPWDDEPAVVITEPVPGSAVGRTVVIRGHANVFEANVGLRVLDATGRRVIETYTTATCGTGCRGTYEKALALPDSLQGEIVIEAFAPSAKDGSDMHKVSTRVRRVAPPPA